MRKLKPKYGWQKRYLHFKNIELEQKRRKHVEELTLQCAEAFQAGHVKKMNNTQIMLAEVIHNKHWTEEELRLMGVTWHRKTEDGMYEEKDIGTVN